MEDVKVFENDGYIAETTQVGSCRLLVKVSVKPKAAQKAYQKAVRQVNKQISIPGFRKGHAPDRTVISRYGSYVEKEWKEFVVNDAYKAALDLTHIYPINKESIDKPKIESCSQEEGAVVRISYEHYPRIPEIDFSQVTIPSIEKESVAEEKVDEVIDEVRRGRANWENIEGRAVVEGDYVDISIHSIQDDKEIVKENRFEVSNKRLPSWLKNALLGMNCGDNLETTSQLDEEAEEHVKNNFKPLQVRITLHAIKKIILPEVDDELAKNAGASSLEDLKNKIRANLEKSAEEELVRKQIAALEDALLELYPFDLPTSLVQTAKSERTKRKVEALNVEALSNEELKERESAIEKEVESEVDRELRLYFLNKQIVKLGNISLSNEELNAELVRYVSQNPYIFGKESNDEAKREFVSRVASSMIERKAKEYALSQLA